MALECRQAASEQLITPPVLRALPERRNLRRRKTLEQRVSLLVEILALTGIDSHAKIKNRLQGADLTGRACRQRELRQKSDGDEAPDNRTKPHRRNSFVRRVIETHTPRCDCPVV